MIIVLLVWAFTATCLFGMGWLCFRRFVREPEDLKGTHPFLIGLVGLITITVATACWNYFASVGPALNILVIFTVGFTLITDRRRVQGYIRHWTERWRALGLPSRLAIGAIFLIALLKSASPTELLDEGDYYLPYIRWIEHHRIIPGLANIEDRFGFNSSFHLASAFFGLSWLVPGGAYELNGLLLLLFGTWCIGALDRLLKPCAPLSMSDMMKLFCLFFLMRNMITSSAADLANMVLAETVLILFVRKIEERTVDRADSGFYLILAGALFVTTLKLSSLLICLVPAYLVFRIPASRRAWGRCVLLGGLIVLPWLGRFPVLSGYLVYPLYQVDLFHVDWKVPTAVAERQYHYVSEFAKTNARPEESTELAENRSLLDWVPQWSARENLLNKAMASAMLAALAGLLLYGSLNLRRSIRDHRDLFALGTILVAGIVLWFLKNPAMRFGWAWGIILLAYCLHLALKQDRLRRVLRWGTLVLFTLFMVQNTAKTVVESATVLHHGLLIPPPMPGAQVRMARLGPWMVRVSDTRQCWGEVPPCLPRNYDRKLELRGPCLEDGFRIAQP